MIQRMGDSKLKTSNDPWDMLSLGLEERRKRELPRALETLRACNLNAQKEGYSTEAKQIKKILKGRLWTTKDNFNNKNFLKYARKRNAIWKFLESDLHSRVSPGKK